MLNAIFFSGKGVAIKEPVKRGKSINGMYCKDVILKEMKIYYRKRRPANSFKHTRRLHDSAATQTCTKSAYRDVFQK